MWELPTGSPRVSMSTASGTWELLSEPLFRFCPPSRPWLCTATSLYADQRNSGRWSPLVVMRPLHPGNGATEVGGQHIRFSCQLRYCIDPVQKTGIPSCGVVRPDV